MDPEGKASRRGRGGAQLAELGQVETNKVG